MGFDMRKIVRFSSDTGIAIVHVSIYIYVLSIELLKCVCKKILHVWKRIHAFFNFSHMHKL